MSTSQATGHLRHSWLCYGICLICALLIKPAQDFFESHLGKAGQEPDLLFFSSPALLKKMALGYDSLLADLYWTRTIQYYGNRDEANKRTIRYKNLFTLLDITTTLDPHLLDAYRFGSVFLSEPEPVGAGQPQEAIKLLDKGIADLPQEWRLPYDKGFVYYIHLKDYKKAGETWLSANRISGSPAWMTLLAAKTLSRGGDLQIAIALWQRQYEESPRADIKKNALNHLHSIKVIRDLRKLEALAEKFKEKTGSYPKDLEELLRGQTSEYSIVDPTGTPYEFDSRTGAVLLSKDSKIQFVPIPEALKE